MALQDLTDGQRIRFGKISSLVEYCDDMGSKNDNKGTKRY